MGRVVVCRHGRELFTQDVFDSRRRRGKSWSIYSRMEEQGARKKATLIEPGADGVLFMLADSGTRVTAKLVQVAQGGTYVTLDSRYWR